MVKLNQKIGNPDPNNPGFLYFNEDGIEFWTRIEDGESAVSERGLSRLSGIPQTTLNRWLIDNGLTQTKEPNWLKPLLNKGLDLTHFVVIKKGKIIKPLSAIFAGEFLALVLQN